MKTSEAIHQQLEFLQKDSTVWVQRVPQEKNEACLLLRYNKNRAIGISSQDDSYICISNAIRKQHPMTWRKAVGTWNDLQIGLSKEDIILILKEAYVIALESEE